MKKGSLITLEGIEGSGKTSHTKLLGKFLIRKGFPVVLTHEPGATQIGKKLRTLLLKGDSFQDPLTELFLFLADRREHYLQIIKKALEEGKIVLCDRFVDSTLAYQGYGRGIDLKFILDLNERILEGTWPDFTILLDCPVEEGLKRTEKKDRLSQETLEFHQRVRYGYLELSKRYPERIRVVNSSDRPKLEVQEEIRKIVLGFLKGG
jgi:dTMP kinase